jgi:hypothetical protein
MWVERDVDETIGRQVIREALVADESCAGFFHTSRSQRPPDAVAMGLGARIDEKLGLGHAV